MSAKTKVVTDPKHPVLFSYANVFQPVETQDGKLEYRVSILIPKSDEKTIEKIYNAIDEAVNEHIDKNGAASAKKITDKYEILHDGDEERPEDPVYAGYMYVNSKSTYKPNVVDARLNRIIDPGEFYSGCFGCAEFDFYVWKNSFGVGLGCGLHNLQKIKDGDPLGGGARRNPEDVFSIVEEEESKPSRRPDRRSSAVAGDPFEEKLPY